MGLSPTLPTVPSDENVALLSSTQPNEHREESSRNHVEPTNAKRGPASAVNSTSTNAAHLEQNNRQCRICGLSEGEEEEEDVDSVSKSSIPYSKVHITADEESQVRRSRKDNPLIRPCRCKGSMMYVHVDCLNRWRVMSPRQESFVACDLCGYKYNIHRPRYAELVSNSVFVRSVTILLVITLTVCMAYVCKAVDVYMFRRPPRPDDPEWLELHGPTVFWMDRVYFLAGIVTVSMLGLVYLVYVFAISSPASPTPFLFCCDQSACPFYSCYLADLSACSGDAALGGLLAFAAFAAIITVVFGIMGIVSGVYALVESFVQKIAGRVKERILEVNL